MGTLGKVADPAALEACARGRAHLRVDVLAAWLIEGADLELTVPARLACARCSGGGCDACARSGVLRAPADAAARVVRARVPALTDDTAVALRLPDPFGEEHPIGQLLVELRPAPSASEMVRIVTAPAPPPAPPRLAVHPLAVAVLVTFAGVLAALLAR